MLGQKEVHELYVSRLQDAILEHVLSDGFYLAKRRLDVINAAAVERLYERSKYDSLCAALVESNERDEIAKQIAQESSGVLTGLGFEESSRGYALRPSSSRIVVIPTDVPYRFFDVRAALSAASPPIVPKPLFGVKKSRDVFLLKTKGDRDRFVDVLKSQSIKYITGQPHYAPVAERSQKMIDRAA